MKIANITDLSFFLADWYGYRHLPKSTVIGYEFETKIKQPLLFTAGVVNVYKQLVWVLLGRI